jgi:hypothetical protein
MRDLAQAERGCPMGSSFVEFRGYGFWAHDSALQIWLYVLAQQIPGTDTIPSWLDVAKRQWLSSALESRPGSVDPSLDRFLIDDERVNKAIQDSKTAVTWLEQYKPFLKRVILNSLVIGANEILY